MSKLPDGCVKSTVKEVEAHTLHVALLRRQRDQNRITMTIDKF